MTQNTCTQFQRVNASSQFGFQNKGSMITEKEDSSQLHQSMSLMPISTICNIGLESCLYVAHDALMQCQRRNLKQCFVDSVSNLVFIQETPCSTNQANKKNQMAIILEIINFLERASYQMCFQDFAKYFQRVSNKRNCHVSYTISLIQTYSQYSKTPIIDKIICYKPGQYKTNRKQICKPISRQRMSQISQVSSSLRKNIKKSKLSSVDASKKSTQIQLKNIKFSQSIICQEASQKTKRSSASTTYKSRTGNQSTQGSRTNFSFRLGASNLFDPYKIKINNSLFPISLQQIDSQSQQTDKDAPSHLTVKKVEPNLQKQSRIVLKQNEQRILSLNNWHKKVSKLIKQSNMKQSFTVQMQGQKQYQSNLLQFNSAVLGKMARVIVRSVMPNQNQS